MALLTSGYVALSFVYSNVKEITEIYKRVSTITNHTNTEASCLEVLEVKQAKIRLEKNLTTVNAISYKS